MDKISKLSLRRYLAPLALVVFVATVGATYFATVEPSAQAQVPNSIYVDTSPAQVAAGQNLFIQFCSTCHGVGAEGSSRAPNLVGVGEATVDFWVATGRMPLAYPTAQAPAKKPLFSTTERHQIVAYVASLGTGGPAIPNVDEQDANVSDGQNLFSLNCSGCHTITGTGDALANGYYAPSLFPATSTEVAEAMATGPGNMPRFGPNQLSTQQVNDIVAYVTEYVQHPVDRGGLGLGHIGPVAEGFVAIALGLGILMLGCYWIAGKAKPEQR